MAITIPAQRVLGEYVARAQSTGVAEKLVINNAVNLTPQQQLDIQKFLTAVWDRPYICPPVLPIMPKHGYESRVLKDGFSGQEYVDWLVAGCSDAAVVDLYAGSRIFLRFGPMLDYPNVTYHLEVPIHADASGKVHIMSVVPKGLTGK
jgi:hypothetical protein